MAAPSQQYFTLFGGGDNAIYTGNKIKIGDNIKISGSDNNDGNFTVVDIRDSGSETIGSAGNDIYYVLRGRAIVDETDSDASVTISVQRGTGDKLLAIGDADNLGIDVWSFNNSTADTDGTPSLADNDGWTTSAINPTTRGADATYIYHFADEALRVCNTNQENSSIIKWYGYIQRNQFNKATGLTFAEWQEHINVLNPPSNVGGISIGYVNGSSGNEHDGTDRSDNYYKNNRGVAYLVKGPASGSATAILLDEAITDSETLFDFDDGVTDNVGNDQFNAGDVVSINTALGSNPAEFLFCTKPAQDDGEVTFSRRYGGYGAATAYSENNSNVLKHGKSFNIGVTEDSTEGLWPSAQWEFYQTFIYDGDQESLPVQFGDGATSLAKGYHPSSGTTEGSKSLKVSTYWGLAYNGRISGGRVYIREKGSSDPLTLFLDIDIEKGVRTSMLDDYNAFGFDSGDGYYCTSMISSGPNIDTYTSLNGFSPEEGFVSIGKSGDSYKASVVAGRRTFIANVTHQNKSFETIKHGDRIMYSELNKFDTFLESNFIDVSKGDYGEYVALQVYADRLLAYKHNLLHIINISNPNPTSWFLESTAQYSGVSFPFNVAKTEFGVAWVNEFGCFFYDGQRIINLVEGKLPITNTTQSTTNTNWSEFVNGTANLKDVILGYDALSNLLIIGRSPNHSTTDSNLAFTYCFNTGGWAYATNLFTDGKTYTNFVTDWNNNLLRAYEITGNKVTFEKYLPVIKEQTLQSLITRDIDFGQPGIKKKIYKVIITYKSTSELGNPLSYSIDGKDAFTTFASGTNITPQGSSGAGYLAPSTSSGTKYDIAVFKADSNISCSSIQFKFSSATANKLEINDISIEYRVIRGATVT